MKTISFLILLVCFGCSAPRPVDVPKPQATNSFPNILDTMPKLR